MCGIAAILRPECDDAGVAGRLLDRVAHRGPDGHAVRSAGDAILGHCRLAIVDVAGGDQPLHSGEGAVSVVCNGEIYNHAELRDVLPARSLPSGSDCAVVPALLDGGDVDALGNLDGMYALAGAAPGLFVAARDRVGIKPLYFGHRGRSLLFASEIRALEGEVARVETLPPGTAYVDGRGIVPLPAAPPCARDIADPEAAVAVVGASLAAAVRSHLMGETGRGVFLSGGLDSTLIALLAAEVDGGVATFSVGAEDSADLAAAERVAQALGARHRSRVVTREDVERDLEAIVLALESWDAALVRSAVGTWYASALATRAPDHRDRPVKFVLTGEGADELFAGYVYFASLDPRDVPDECEALLAGMHNLQLQRVDRMTMAHGLEGRVPFLSAEVMAAARRLAGPLFAADDSGRTKPLLREAFAARLDPAILARPKAEFAQGAGLSGIVADVARSRVHPGDWRRAQAAGCPARTLEEFHHYRLIENAYRTPWGPGVGGTWGGPLL